MGLGPERDLERVGACLGEDAVVVGVVHRLSHLALAHLMQGCAG